MRRTNPGEEQPREVVSRIDRGGVEAFEDALIAEAHEGENESEERALHD